MAYTPHHNSLSNISPRTNQPFSTSEHQKLQNNDLIYDLTLKLGPSFRWYNVSTGLGDEYMETYTEILQWGPEEGKLYDDLTKALWWTANYGYNGSNSANTLRGTDGQQFHPSVQDDEQLWIFSTDLCRSMYLEYEVK